MRVMVTGGTGFIGAAMCEHLRARGHDVLVLTRGAAPPSARAGTTRLSWETTQWRQALSSVDALINLAGEPLVAKRWTPDQRARIHESRVQTTRRLIEAIATSPHRPTVLISASAIGFYGSRGGEPLTEASACGTGFLPDLCRAWEAEAQRAEPLGVRVVRLRIGVVLERGGGALAKMIPPFLLFAGGPIGSGRQWVSWIHRDDVIGLIEWALTHPDVAGALNATAPTPVTMHDFCWTLGHVLHRPSWLPVPANLLYLLAGDMAEVLVTGQRVVPELALRAGYPFAYPTLDRALAACVGRHA